MNLVDRDPDLPRTVNPQGTLVYLASPPKFTYTLVKITDEEDRSRLVLPMLSIEG